LYRADLNDVAAYLQQHPELADAGITGLLTGPWDRQALRIALGEDPLDTAGCVSVQLRWYDPRRAILLEVAGMPATLWQGYPVVESIYDAWIQIQEGVTAGGYTLATVLADEPLSDDSATCFANGLCLTGYRFASESGLLDLIWRVDQPLTLPEIPLISKPPPPGVYDGPRLLVFAQLIDGNGSFLVGDDGLWVDPTTLQVGDLFMQQHRLGGQTVDISAADAGAPAILIGLYDPLTGERILTLNRQDHVRLEIRDTVEAVEP